MIARIPQPRTRPDPLLSVWPAGELDGYDQLAEGRYVPETAQDVGRMPPAIAAHAITAYTRPGDTVVDPDCGAGTVLVEALRLNRGAVGLTGHRRWWPVARANVTAAKHDGATPDGMVLDHPPAAAAARLAALVGHVGLVLFSLRPAPAGHQRIPAETDGGRAPYDAVARLREALNAFRPLVRPGGHIIVTVRPQRHRGHLLDLTGQAHRAAHAAGLVPVERCVALLAELRGDRLVLKAPLAQRRRAVRHARATGHPIALTAHLDVLVLRVAHAAAAADAVRPLHPLPTPHHRAAECFGHDDLLREAA
ncbi:DNA methyltransferase [Streptomyces sp. NPDC091217]|uniref:DNA methyltransferase n=1 Tax=Streptomyces sp. NPDC091217 TaxID=3365975 RepID=UPI003818C87D